MYFEVFLQFMCFRRLKPDHFVQSFQAFVFLTQQLFGSVVAFALLAQYSKPFPKFAICLDHSYRVLNVPTGCVSDGFGQINGVCSPAASTAACPAPSSGRVRPDPPRRSRSQGTRKLHKCLSTASYSEDCGSHVPCTTSAPTATQRQQQLLVARQYCSFGSTVTRILR